MRRESAGFTQRGEKGESAGFYLSEVSGQEGVAGFTLRDVGQESVGFITELGVSLWCKTTEYGVCLVVCKRRCAGLTLWGVKDESAEFYSSWVYGKNVWGFLSET